MKWIFALLLVLGASVTTQALYLDTVQAPSRRTFLADEAEPSKEDVKRSD
ncbi:hypothetical protein EDD18DRAFT_1349758 [Armillaria luteobubalina]|uniref:Uncharacterized protein n=1 Tax=Armillaria luteobubalina TaxID=153913 RepID=A0AA39UVQ5_9AGAR|nr:hypothetical protein EDD18DRAFT_1349758 [Armillaria luteobubalina]